MTGGSPAYYVTIKKDKRLKGFYWMVNTKGSYSLLQTVIKNNGMNMTADKAPSVENTPEIRAFMETTVAAYRVEIPGMEQPLRAIEMVDVLRDLKDRDLVRKDTLGQTLEKQLDDETGELPKRNTRQSMEKQSRIKNIKEKWVLSAPGSQQEDEGEVSSHEDGATQVLNRMNHIFNNSPVQRKQGEGSGESDKEETENDTEGDNTESGVSQEGGEASDKDGNPPPYKKLRRVYERHEVVTEQGVEEAMQRVCKKCENNIVGVVENSAAGTMEAVDKGYEQSRKGTREVKLAIANCYEAIQQGNKLATVTEHNVKELIKAQKVTNALLAELTERMEKMENEKGNQDSQDKPFRPFYKKYCAFCKEGTHDLDECKEKIMCFRCGDYNHKASACYWLDRSCGRCQTRGHKREMHETTDADARELLVTTFPKSFTHFLKDSIKAENPNGKYADKGRGGTRGKGADSRRYRS